MNHPHLQKALQASKPFQIGNYIIKGFQLFGNNVGNFVGYSIGAVLLMLFATSIPMVGGWASKYLLFPPLTVGIYLVAHQLKNNEMIESWDYLGGFKHVVRLALAAIAINIIAGVATIPFIIANNDLIDWAYSLKDMAGNFNFDFDGSVIIDGFPGFYSWKLLLLLPMIACVFLYSWTSLFIIFYGLNVWDAMEASRQIILKNWLIYFLFSLALLIIGFGGMAGFLIGVFFAYPAMLCIDYIAFADMTDLNKVQVQEEYVGGME